MVEALVSKQVRKRWRDMDAHERYGWGKLYDEAGNFLWKRTLANAGWHGLAAFFAGMIAGVLAAQFGGFGVRGSILFGVAGGILAIGLREAIQWAKSYPHLVDRAIDLAPSPLGGALGGLAGWAVSLLF